MRTGERAYSTAEEQRYLFARCMVPYHHAAGSVISAGLKVLDAGCGAGDGAAVLARAGATVAALDFSHVDVALAVRGNPCLAGLVADVYSLPYADRSFDFVMSCHVLEHLHEPERYLRQMERVLRPGGSLWVITPNRSFSSPQGPPTNPFHVKEYFRDEFTQLIQSVFSNVQFKGISHRTRGVVAQAEQRRHTMHALDPWKLRRYLPRRIKAWARALSGAPYPVELRQVGAEDFEVMETPVETAVDHMAVVRI